MRNPEMFAVNFYYSIYFTSIALTRTRTHKGAKETSGFEPRSSIQSSSKAERQAATALFAVLASASFDFGIRPLRGCPLSETHSQTHDTDLAGYRQTFAELESAAAKAELAQSYQNNTCIHPERPDNPVNPGVFAG